MELYQKYRPKRLAQVVGQDKAVSSIRRVLQARNFDRGAFWIEGASGIGKSTLAYCIAHQLTNGNQWGVTEIDGSACRIDTVREFQQRAEGPPSLLADWHIIIVNEAHAMRQDAVAAWLTLLEKLPAKWVVVFTSMIPQGNLWGEMDNAFASRCRYLKLTNQGLCETFARLVHRVAAREGLDGQPYESYVKLAKNLKNNCRAMFQAVELGEV